jgi:hypothetical protein
VAELLRIATLGPAGTCSEDVSAAYLQTRGLPVAECLDLRGSYEDAVALVLRGDADLVVVPAAYRDYHEISFSHLERLQLVDILYSAPAFVLVAPAAGRAGPPARPRVACHPSPSPLLRRLDFRHEPITAASNAEAARMVADGRADFAVTFQGAFEAYAPALVILRSFGAVDMIWGVFGRGREGALGSFWAADLERAAC